MKQIGYLLIAVGFLGGAILSVLDEWIIVSWSWFISALLVGAGGVLAVRLATIRASRSEGVMETNLQDVVSSLENVVRNIDALNQEKDALNVYEFRHRIDALFPADLNTFVESREVIVQVHGLQAYADVMSIFAAGERYLNRVWSASADGYIDEVTTYVGRAATQFAEAHAKLLELGETLPE
ncbi:MAG: hypothetical protein IIC41_06390 [Candidatus Marinimicrobia bacterium]|nr:hypothetical protein [Candidatus Neomarinimicrobiota bacterium]